MGVTGGGTVTVGSPVLGNTLIGKKRWSVSLITQHEIESNHHIIAKDNTPPSPNNNNSVCVCVCSCVVRACMHACMRAWVCERAWTSYVSVCVCKYVHESVRACMCVRVSMHVCACVSAHPSHVHVWCVYFVLCTLYTCMSIKQLTCYYQQHWKWKEQQCLHLQLCVHLVVAFSAPPAAPEASGSYSLHKLFFVAHYSNILFNHCHERETFLWQNTQTGWVIYIIHHFIFSIVNAIIP